MNFIYWSGLLGIYVGRYVNKVNQAVKSKLKGKIGQNLDKHGTPKTIEQNWRLENIFFPIDKYWQTVISFNLILSYRKQYFREICAFYK